MISVKRKIGNTTTRSANFSIFIQEGSFTVKNLKDEGEKFQAHCLRHKIFCKELEWVPQSNDTIEIDDYDDNAVFFGIFNEQNSLVAFLRLILPEKDFMIEKVFSFLVESKHKIRKENDTAEISRLCVSPEARNDTVSGNFGIHNISMFLYKGLYHWCLKNNIRCLYLVVEHKVYRLCRAKGFPCELIGQPLTMPDGVKAVAAIMDWREFEALNTVKRPEMMRWFSQYQSTPVPWQLQQPDFYLQHQAFA